MLPDELLRKIQQFHFKTRHSANELFAGQYESAYKGRGMEFAEVRDYQPGDDIRTIDWNVSARFGRPFVKVFHEERELTVILLLDLSGSHLFGTRERFKRELLAEIAGLLAFLAIRTNDRVGAVLFTSRVEKFIPPKKGAAHVWHLIREIFAYTPEERTTSLAAVLDYLNRAVKRHAIVFLISDCEDQGFERPLRLAARKHDVTVVRIGDAAEDELPRLGWAWLTDPESGRTTLVNTGSRRVREAWRRARGNQRAYLAHTFKRAGVDWVELLTGEAVVEPLMRLFVRRGRRF